MLTIYMAVWSVFIIMTLGITRVRNIMHLGVALLISLLILLLSQSLFEQLALTAGMHPSMALLDPGQFLGRGPFAWLAMLVMPFGWLGPVLGLRIVERWQPDQYELG